MYEYFKLYTPNMLYLIDTHILRRLPLNPELLFDRDDVVRAEESKDSYIPSLKRESKELL